MKTKPDIASKSKRKRSTKRKEEECETAATGVVSAATTTAYNGSTKTTKEEKRTETKKESGVKQKLVIVAEKKKRQRIAGNETSGDEQVQEEGGEDNIDKKKKRKKKTEAQSQKQNESDDEHVGELDTKDATKAVTSRCVSDIDEEFPLLLQQGRPVVESSGLLPGQIADNAHTVTLLLFYQYVEPPWDDTTYIEAQQYVQQLGQRLSITGRMRVAKEGLNCTLTSSRQNILRYCNALREWKPVPFMETEFKLTNDLPEKQRFPALKMIPVQELVHYGLEGDKAPPIQRFQGTHLEPSAYHAKLAESDTVVIDVRNHYEAIIGRFDPPNAKEKWIDPKMRKSTEFPAWLDEPETKEKLRNKQVLMYCTGGIRCERASALLKYKMETDESVKDLNIQGVYQLQGGIDKYFKEFPDGGYWKGKNYTFDKRFAHVPIDNTIASSEAETSKPAALEEDDKKKAQTHEPLSKCEACGKAWDKFRGKRRCPTCGVPSLICKDCYLADQKGVKKLGREVRCDLCVEQNIFSKKDLRDYDQQRIREYENRYKEKGLLLPKVVVNGVENNADQESADAKQIENPNGVTRLYLRNMCRKNMTEKILMDHISGITHIVWKLHRNKNNRHEGEFMGQGWVEMESPAAAAAAVSQSGQMKILGRPLYLAYDPPNAKDCWPPPNSSVKH